MKFSNSINRTLGVAIVLTTIITNLLCLCWAVRVDIKESNRKLEVICTGIKSFKHLSEMENLIGEIKKHGIDLFRSNRPTSSWTSYLGFSDHLKLCIDQLDAILDLEPLIKERNNVCKSSHIDKIEAYKTKHLPDIIGSIKQSKITKNFFYLYSAQVSVICKKNLLQSLNLANNNFITKANYESVMPWLKNKSLCKQTDSNIRGPSDQEQIRCDAIEVLNSIRSISELSEIMRNTTQQWQQINFLQDLFPSMYEQTGLSSNKSINDSYTSDGDSTKLILPETMRPELEIMIDTCSKCRKVYANTIMPIVRLASLGINPKYRNFDRKCHDEELIQRWLTVTAICQTMLHSSFADEKLMNAIHNNRDTKTSVVLVTGDSSSGNQKDEIEVPEFFSNEIENKLWIAKYLPNSFTKLRTEFTTKLVKTFKLNHLNDGVIFDESVKRTYNNLMKGFIGGFILAALGQT